MRVKISGIGEVRIWFRHENLEGGRTFAYLSIGDSDEPLVRGVAVKSKSDQFNKAKGRRVALTRLLQECDGGISSVGNYHRTLPLLTPDDRREVWSEYFKQHRDLKHG